MATSGSTGISRVWDPNKMFDLSVTDKQAIEERAQMRTALKKQWQMKVSSPYRGVGGYIFDPTVQRYLSMKANYYSQFKATPKNFGFFMASLVIPLGVLVYYTDKELKTYDGRCRRGEIAYEDRKAKFV